MGRMKNIFMDLHYTFDGCIPPNFDYQAYFADILNKEEQEENEKNKKKENMSGSDKNTSVSETPKKT